tara:strand:+ start:245 stop:502 length:258 start_codon:yes stop_codon:yes gene_type:complete
MNQYESIMKKILFMCVAYSARSQMAEGIAKTLYPNIEFKSAGSIPSKVNLIILQIMRNVECSLAHGTEARGTPTFFPIKLCFMLI